MQTFLTVLIETVAAATVLLIVLCEASKLSSTAPPADPAPAAPPLTVAPVIARAMPSLVQQMPRRALLQLAKQRRVPHYSRTDTATLRALLAAS